MHRNFSVKSAFFGVHKKSESITEYRITKAPSWSQLQIFFTWYALHIVFLSFVQLFSFFCVSVRCVYLLFFIIEPTLNKHLPAVSRGYTVCVYMSVFLTLIHKTIFFFFAALKLNAHPSLWYLRWNMSPHRFTLYFSLITLCVFVCTVVFCHCFARERFYMLYALQKQQQMPQPSSI